MRYNVHSPCTFHNRIARYLGVLVAAALVAALGLPSAVQAQTPAAPMVTGEGDGTVGSDGTITATWGRPLDMNSDQDGWMLEHTEPGVAWDDAEMTPFKDDDKDAMTSGEILAGDPRIHHGVWRFRVSYWNHDATMTDGDSQVAIKGGERVGTASDITDYQHGPPTAAPTGFAAYPAGPDARRLVWDVVKGTSYDTRYTADETDDDEWTDWKVMSTSGMVVDDLDLGVEYTFELRALGASRAGVGDLHGPSASITEMMAVPAPTLPEIALLLLAMLLLGSGVYLLRGRQSGGLTHA